jgi:hypothetical protein
MVLLPHFESFQGAQYNAMICLPPRGTQPPIPLVGVDTDGQRGWAGLHWIP